MEITLTNNDILRRLRYAFNWRDKEVVKIFALVEQAVTLEQVAGWMIKEEDEGHIKLNDKTFAYFLNGLIIQLRGRREGDLPKAESRLGNNLVFQKLRIALNLRTEDIIELFDLAKFEVGKHELNAFFRKPGTKNYRECKDQILRTFLAALAEKHRPKKDSE